MSGAPANGTPMPSGPVATTETGADASESQAMLRAKASVEAFAESYFFVGLMSILTIWALYSSDIRLAATTKEADLPFLVIISIAFFLFILEIALSCFYRPDYVGIPDWKPLPRESPMDTWLRRLQFGSFYFWLDWIATGSLVLELNWMLGDSADAVTGGSVSSARAGRAGARAGRTVRLIRMVRLVRMVKLYKYATAANEKRKGEQAHETPDEEDDLPKESHVGAAMSDLTNRRVIVLILAMLIFIPLLTTTDANIALSVGTEFVGNLASLNSTQPEVYESGLLLGIDVLRRNLPVIQIVLGDNVFFRDDDKMDSLRTTERVEVEESIDGFTTKITFDQQDDSIQGALFSIYTTSFIIVLLIGGTYFFSSDVNKLVIGPIERLVDLVRKISANPLGVEYKMLGAKEGFLEGMETTVLLTTITKIGGLMRVGFGEAGASVIAKNLAESAGGRLNLMGAGTMIHSIFGFCDVRQFTDTTECLQEEVMLFVNRIAHILHSIVVQCSGSANKNIGDAFLLTWKLDEKYDSDKIASLADQALLAFLKSLIELSRHQEFICNFSAAANARLFKRFPEYAVRIGCGLHVGWAIEGAIGSNRKIDASYLSPNVNTSEFLESSTKAYGVPLLLSEPFFKLLSPVASKYCRQVDRIRRSALEEPMGLFTYDADMNIDWNDPYRNKPKPEIKHRLKAAVRRATRQSLGGAAANALGLGGGHLPTLSEGSAGQTTSSDAAAAHTNTRGSISPSGTAPSAGRKKSRDDSTVSGNPPVPPRGRRGSLVGGLPMQQNMEPVNEKKKEEEDPLLDVENRLERAKEAPTIVLKPYEHEVWTEDADIVELRHRVSDSYRALWEDGFAAYVKGDWQKARDIFHETMRLSKNKDGPSKFLMEIIDGHGGNAPHDWAGYRLEE